MQDTAKVRLGTASLTEAEKLKHRLNTHGFDVALIHNQATCTRGCSVQVEIWVHPADVQAIAALLGEERSRELAAMGYDARLAEEVFDPEAETALCPACGTRFSTKSRQCPECELCFDAPAR